MQWSIDQARSLWLHKSILMVSLLCFYGYTESRTFWNIRSAVGLDLWGTHGEDLRCQFSKYLIYLVLPK